MKKAIPTILLPILCCVCFFSCSIGVIKSDRLPSGVPRGYVKFYQLKEDNLPYGPEIYSIERGKRVFEGRIPLIDKTDRAFRSIPGGVVQVAKAPGTHHFVVALGNLEKDVYVKVEQGKATPVRITYSNVSTISVSPIFRMQFRMHLSVEEMVPFTK